MADNSDTPEGSLDELMQALAKYNRANKAQKQKLGGTGYKTRLERAIATLEAREPSLQLHDESMDVDLPTNPIEKLLDLLPFTAIDRFKTAWNASRAVSHADIKGLEVAWEGLQQAAAPISAAHRLASDPAWPGPSGEGIDPPFDNILATAEWLRSRVPTFELPLPPMAEREFQLWDRQKGENVLMTHQMLLEARTNPGSYKECIEGGKDLVLRVLTNRNKKQKCISCESGARGQNAPSKGQKLRGTGPGFLETCGCPIDGALIEFWMFKVTSDDPQVPKRDPPSTTKSESEYPASDFSLNPVSLRVIGGAIEAASGLTPETMFTEKRERLETTVLWALDELQADADIADQCKLFKKAKSHFKATMKQVHEHDLGDVDSS